MKMFQATVFTSNQPIHLLVAARSKGEAARTAVAHVEVSLGLISHGCEASLVKTKR